MKAAFLILLSLTCFIALQAQSVPTSEENIPYLVTFGKESVTSWGDDDFCQIFFFIIPTSQIKPIYFRVYDPDCGGDIDEPKGDYSTKTTFSIYGGKRCFSEPDARKTNPSGNYKSGNLLASKTFGVNPKYNKSWYTFGPFNPTEGEYSPEYGGYVFKVIAYGTSGDDGNLYRYFLSTSATENQSVEGSNAFTYEYTFRMHDDPRNISHIYPYIDDKAISIKISNFDWDDDGVISIVSVSKNGVLGKISGDNDWANSTHPITAEEKNSSLDIQFIKNKKAPAKNNNVVLFVTNQYGEQLPFYIIPIGGIPKFKGEIGVRPGKK